MQIQIQFINANVEDKGKYKQAEIAFKDLAKGQVSSKKLMSFTNPVVYKTLVDAKNGEIYTIDMEKNEKGYWDWIKAVTSTSVDTSNAVSPSKASVAPKSTYETPEERAKKQVYIVRQSSISSAIDYMNGTGAIKKATAADVIFCAKEFESYVFGLDTGITPLADLPTVDTDDDIPM
jgi:hypothetical protein